MAPPTSTSPSYSIALATPTSASLDWNGVIAFWIDTMVFAVYTGVFITLLMQMIKREDFGEGPLPSLDKRNGAQS